MTPSLELQMVQESRTPDEILKEHLERIIDEIIKEIVVKGRHVNRTKTANKLLEHIKEIYGE